ncbi:MAG: glycoside hydrolase family 26 protein [Acidimicrobiia bacterium]
MSLPVPPLVPSASSRRRRRRAGLILGSVVAVAAVAASAIAVLSWRGREGAGRALPPPERTVEELPEVEPPSAMDTEPVGAYFGVHTKVDGANAETRVATERLEERLGRKVDINHHFYPWDEVFPTDLERWDHDHGRIPMISWNGRGPYARDIADGDHDELIVDRARRVRAFGDHVMIRWFWEMDGVKKARWAGDPEDYIAAWRHIHRIFAAEGATNVSWIWCPNASAFEDGEAQAFYPGAAYVDWICGDGYNWAPGRDGDPWESFDEIFGGFYAWASQRGKPIMVGEYGVQERRRGDKADWIAEVVAVSKTRYPLIRAYVYFNADQDYDWRMDTSDTSTEAFRAMANDPWFNSLTRGELLKQ